MKTQILKSIGSVKINGQWFDEVAKEMTGLRVTAIKIRSGEWFEIGQIQVRA